VSPSFANTDYHNLDMYLVCPDASLKGLPSATNTRAVNNGPDSLLLMVILECSGPRFSSSVFNDFAYAFLYCHVWFPM